MAEAVKEKEKLERKSSKSRLAKQDEVEEVEEDNDNSPSSEASDATVIPAGGNVTPVVNTPSGGSPESNSPDDGKDGGKKLEQQKSTDSGSPTQGGNPKVKLLVRSHALCDDASPPPEDSATSKATTSQPSTTVTTTSATISTSTEATTESTNVASVATGTPTTATTTTSIAGNDNTTIATATLSVASLSPTPSRGSRHRSLEKDGSQGSVTSHSGGTSPCLSRDSSTETYTDSTGIDLEEFIRTTLNKNPKDRVMLMKLETEMHAFIKESKHEFLKFPQMSSYHRMLVHRIAAFFGLDHNVDQSGKCVVVNRTPNTRIPDFKFKDHLRDESSYEDQPKRQILKRESASFEEGRNHLSIDKKSKSFEEREEDYKKARDRIFSQQEVLAFKSSSSTEGAPMLLESPLSKPSTRQSSARSSKEDLRWSADARPWSSTDSSGYSTDSSMKLKVNMTKASSFGGVTVLSRSESRTSSISGGRLSKTDSLSSGASSNLGSPMNRPPPIPSSPPLDGQSESTSSSQSAASPSQSQCHQGESPTPVVPPVLQCFGEQSQPMAVWVASTLDSIPPGSIIINPQTCQPYTLPDGSLYRFQPPPKISVQPHLQSQQMQQPPPQMLTPVPTSQQQTYLQPPQQYPYQPPPQIISPQDPNKQYTREPSEMTTQFSSMTLTPQHSLTPQSSTESTSDPPGYTPQQPQQMYMMPGQPVQQQQQPPQQQQQQPGFVQYQQMSYSTPNPPAGSAPPVRYMYPTMQYTEGQGQPGMPGATSQSQLPAGGQNGGVQYAPTAQQGYVPGYGAQQGVPGGYQVVTSGAPEGAYPQQTYQPPPPVPPGGATVPAYPQPMATGTGPAQGGPPPPPVVPGQQGQGDAIQAQPQQSFSQYQALPQAAGGGGPVAAPPQSFAGQQSVPMYYPSPSVASSNGLSVQTSYPVQASAMTSMAVSQVTVTGQQGSYRPRSPPSQSGVPSIAPPSSQTSVNGITVSPSTPQYVTYTTSYPVPAPQRASTPGAISFQPQSPPQAGTNFPLVRPNMQAANMQLATGARTTPPLGGATGQYLPAQVPTIVHGGTGPSGQPVKFITVDQRVFTSTDNSKDTAPNGNVSGATGIAVPASAIPKPVSVRPVGTTITYRAPAPINPDVRLIGQPLQQQALVPRPQIQPLFQARPRMPSPVTSQTGAAPPAGSRGRGRKSWSKSSKDSASPQSSTESTGSSETYFKRQDQSKYLHFPSPDCQLAARSRGRAVYRDPDVHTFFGTGHMSRRPLALRAGSIFGGGEGAGTLGGYLGIWPAAPSPNPVFPAPGVTGYLAPAAAGPMTTTTSFPTRPTS